MSRRWAGRAFVVLLVLTVLYLPVRRQMLDLGIIRAALFRSSDGVRLTLWDNDRYQLGATAGRYAIERFPEVPWISSVRLDTGQRLYVKWQDRVYRIEDIPDLTASGVTFSRD